MCVCVCVSVCVIAWESSDSVSAHFMHNLIVKPVPQPSGCLDYHKKGGILGQRKHSTSIWDIKHRISQTDWQYAHLSTTELARATNQFLNLCAWQIHAQQVWQTCLYFGRCRSAKERVPAVGRCREKAAGGDKKCPAGHGGVQWGGWSTGGLAVSEETAGRDQTRTVADGGCPQWSFRAVYGMEVIGVWKWSSVNFVPPELFMVRRRS